MFVRTKTNPNSPRISVQIVANERVESRVRQRIMRHVGVAENEEELARLKELAEYLKAQLEEEQSPTLFGPEKRAQWAIEARQKAEKQQEESLQVDLKKLREEYRIIVGIHDIYGKLFEELGFHRAIGAPSLRKEASKILKHLVMARIANPSSKRNSTIALERDFGIKLNLTSVYRCMDYLDDKQIQFIQTRAWQAAMGLFNEKIDVVFYDCTTLYFESVEEDDIRAKGYSKDMKFNQSQVVLALLVTKEGIPVSYCLYKGSIFEGDTVTDAIEHIEKYYQVNQVVFVADSAMFSDVNLTLLEEYKDKGYKYIVGARLKNQNKTINQMILDRSGYTEKNGIEYREIMLEKGRRLLVNYSAKRAKKDSKDRERAINKLMKKLKKSKNPQSFISNYGYKKYLKIRGKGQVEIEQNKVANDAQWDGLHGVITNMEGTADKIFTHYKGLWQVEEAFRITKHDLQVRPVFHWTPKRIKAHVAICFMALVCVQHLTYRVALQYKPLSAEIIRNELNHVQLSILQHQDTQKRYAIPARPTQHARKIYQVMGKKLSTVPFAMN